jgi:hypothetical protein
MSTKYVRELLESVDVLNPELVYERIGEALQELRQVEAARAKDAELIQMLVDGVIGIYWMGPEASKKLMTELLATAATAGFKPTDQ